MSGQPTAGIDIGGTKLLGVVLDHDGTIRSEQRARTPLRHHAGPSAAQAGTDAVIYQVSLVARRLIQEVPEAAALGVGAPGLVDDAGFLHVAPNLSHAEGLDIKGSLRDAIGIERVVVDNDATCAAVAEWQMGAARGARHALVVTLGTGIGAGIVSGGRVMRGASGFAGEAGHMVVDPSGPRCPCGQRGCWERYASGSGLARLALEAAQAGRLDEVVRLAGDDPEAVRGEHVSAAAAKGDPEAKAVLAELGWWLALGLANLVNLLDPEVVVLGGGLVEAGDDLFEPAKREFASMVQGAGRRPPIPIVAAALGERAGAVGAALIARHPDRYGPGGC